MSRACTIGYLLWLVTAYGCDSTEVSGPRYGVEGVIGPGGGRVAGPRGTELDVPAGALDEESIVTITEAMEGFPDPRNLELRSPVFAFEPHGTTFATPVTIRIPLPEGGDGDYAMVASPEAGEWVHVEMARNTGEHLEVETPHFSYFAVVSSESLDVELTVDDDGNRWYCGSLGQTCCTNGTPCLDGLRCVPVTCDSTCAPDCFDYECVSVCEAKHPDGDTCLSGAECASNLCVDGVCCDDPCEGQCEACDAFGQQGHCVPVLGEPHGDRPGCDSPTFDAVHVPCGYQCNGVDPDRCLTAHAGELCGTGCATGLGGPDSVFNIISVCDGFGRCRDAYRMSCAPYDCDADHQRCRSDCLTDTDCAIGAVCVGDLFEGRCVVFRPYGYCSDDLTSYTHYDTPEESQSFYCGVYDCHDSQPGCRDTCIGDADCAPGYFCRDRNCGPG